ADLDRLLNQRPSRLETTFVTSMDDQQWLIALDFCADFFNRATANGEINPIGCLRSAGAKLHTCSTDQLSIHFCNDSAAWCADQMARRGAMNLADLFKHGSIATLCFDQRDNFFPRSSVVQPFFQSRARRVRNTFAQIEHEFYEIRGAASLQRFHRFTHFERVTDRAAERLVHGRKQIGNLYAKRFADGGHS